jgi:hypothetical protein
MSLFQAKQDDVERRYDRHAPGLNHLAFHVPSRQHVEDLHGHLCGIGAKILRAPAEYPYTPGYYAVFFADPDGMKLEIVFEPAQGAAHDACPACGVLIEKESPQGCAVVSRLMWKSAERIFRLVYSTLPALTRPA